MNRKKIIIVSVIFVCLGVAILSRSVDRNKVIYGLSEGTYTVEGAENATVPASITFDLNKDTFSFSYDLLSSYLPHGTWEIEKGKVLATTHDKNYVYIFDIIDNVTLKFVQKGSSTITYTDENINTNPSIVDGTKFVLSDPR